MTYALMSLRPVQIWDPEMWVALKTAINNDAPAVFWNQLMERIAYGERAEHGATPMDECGVFASLRAASNCGIDCLAVCQRPDLKWAWARMCWILQQQQQRQHYARLHYQSQTWTGNRHLFKPIGTSVVAFSKHTPAAVLLVCPRACLLAVCLQSVCCRYTAWWATCGCHMPSCWSY